MARGIITSLSALGALGAAISAGVVMREGGEPAAAVAELRTAGQSVCTQSNVRLVEGMSRGCLTSADYEALRDRPVLGPDGAPVIVNLSSPDDQGEAAVRNCAEYDARAKGGWYALTNSDMRKEEFFKRACGALALLVEAKPAEVSHFADGKADRSDIASMAATEALEFGEAQPSTDVEISEVDAGVWKVTIGSGETMVYEIAHADFTGDGVGEILSYVSVGARGGTARAGTIGLLEKNSEAGPCSFRAQ